MAALRAACLAHIHSKGKARVPEAAVRVLPYYLDASRAAAEQVRSQRVGSASPSGSWAVRARCSPIRYSCFRRRGQVPSSAATPIRPPAVILILNGYRLLRCLARSSIAVLSFSSFVFNSKACVPSVSSEVVSSVPKERRMGKKQQEDEEKKATLEEPSRPAHLQLALAEEPA